MVNQRYDLGQQLLSNKLLGMENKRQADLTVQLGRQGNLNGGIAEGARNDITQGTQANMTQGTTNLEMGRLQTLANLKMKEMDANAAQQAADADVFGNIMKTIGTIGGAIVGTMIAPGPGTVEGASIGAGVASLPTDLVTRSNPYGLDLGNQYNLFNQ